MTKLGPPLVVLVIAAALLEAGSRAGAIAPTALPAPSAIAAGFADIVRNGELVRPALITFGLMLASTACAAVVAIPFGIVLARARAFGAAYEPWLGGLFASPLVLIYPIFLVVLHRTYVMVIVMSAITASIPIVIQTRLGMLHVPPVLRAVGHSFNL